MARRCSKQVTASTALRVLRTVLTALSFPNAAEYRTHDLRRGMRRTFRSQADGWKALVCFAEHALLPFGGAKLWQILEAGEWRSPAFMKYLDVHRLETDLVVQAHIDDESESDDDAAANECGSLSTAADSSA